MKVRWKLFKMRKVEYQILTRTWKCLNPDTQSMQNILNAFLNKIQTAATAAMQFLTSYFSSQHINVLYMKLISNTFLNTNGRFHEFIQVKFSWSVGEINTFSNFILWSNVFKINLAFLTIFKYKVQKYWCMCISVQLSHLKNLLIFPN